MSVESNIASVRRLLEEAFSEGNYEVIDEIVAPELVEHQNGAQGTGPEATRRVASGLRESFPDLQLEIEDIAGADETVWVRARGHGTDTGGVAGRPPSGAHVEVDVIDVVRFRDGKMVEHWGVADRLGMLQQVGAVPAPRDVPDNRQAIPT